MTTIKTKIIFVIGGVFSGIGKGIISGSIGKLFKHSDLSVSMQKHDPYLNVDCGLLSPFEHGEVFVTKDGLETDLDLGNYERFLSQKMSAISSITAGQIYQELLSEERNRKYQGKTINIYHVAQKIREKILLIAQQEKKDCLVVEFGGTLGDNDLKPFLIAAAQLKRSLFPNQIAFVLLVYIHYLEHLSQFKTKPAQNAIANLRANAIEPDFVILRSYNELDHYTKEKFSRLCYLPLRRVFAIAQKEIHFIPTLLAQNGFFPSLIQHLNIAQPLNTTTLNAFSDKITTLKKVKAKITIGVINKYSNFQQSYFSLQQAIMSTAANVKIRFNIIEINPEKLTKNNVKEYLNECDGILVPGGFDVRGVEGKMWAIQYARRYNIPFLGICLGFQVALIEFARYQLGLSNATSEEFIKKDQDDSTLIIRYYDSQKQKIIIGEKEVAIESSSFLSQIVGKDCLHERFRNRLIFNNQYIDLFQKHGFVFSAFQKINDTCFPVAFELKGHSFFLGAQFHLELNAFPETPHPILITFFQKCLEQQKK